MANETKKKDMNRNPTGKGGFQERPQDRVNGRWRSEDSISYQYNKMLRMSTKEFDTFLTEHADDMTMAQELAYKAVKRSRSSLADIREVTDRTEGKAPQSIDLTSGGDKLNPFGELTTEQLRKLAEGS